MYNNSNLNIYTKETKKLCSCVAISIFLILLFVISPLSKYLITSLFGKLLIIAILVYAILLNNSQTDILKKISGLSEDANIKKQININIICSYTFTLFMFLLIFFIIKSFF